MKRITLIAAVLSLASCTTMNESLQLGAGLGALTGAAATYAGHSGAGARPTLEDVGLGAGIGMGLGLIASYFTFKAVDQNRRDNQAYQTEIYFGDLPPSPFLIPKQNQKKGGR
jgi:hypothetical protein